MSLLVLVICIGCSQGSQQDKEDNNIGNVSNTFTWEPKTIYNENNIIVSIEDVEIDDWNSTTLSIHVNNNSEDAICLSFDDAQVAVNDIVSSFNSPCDAVQPGESGDVKLQCWIDDMAKEVVEMVSTIELFHVNITDETGDQILYTMPTVGIGIPGREDYVQKEDNEGEQLIEFLGVRLYLKDIKNDGSILFNYYEIVNTSNSNVHVYFQNIKINGYMCDEWGKDYGIWPVLPAGTSTYEFTRIKLPPRPLFVEDDFDYSLIEDVREISFNVLIEDEAHEYHMSDTVTVKIK